MQLVGMSPIHTMTEVVLMDAVEEPLAESLLEQSPVLNTYLVFEIVSDDLALGLGTDPSLDAPTQRLRRQLLTGFNTAAMRALSQETPASSILLADLRPDADRIAYGRHMLNGPAYSRLIDAYSDHCGQLVSAEVSKSLWPLLVGNLTAARNVLSATRNLRYGAEMNRYLIGRYSGVNHLIGAAAIDGLAERLDHSVDSVSVAATLGYYIAFLLERPEYGSLVSDEVEPILFQALRECARLVRLLNDIGPALLETSRYRDDLSERIARAEGGGDAPFSAVLAGVCAGEKTTTRLEKDLLHGETNVALHGLQALPASQAAPRFVEALDFYAHVYAQAEQSLITSCNELDAITGRVDASSIILRFYEFHNAMYGASFTDAGGEYSGVPFG
jgi:hypothetical protein